MEKLRELLKKILTKEVILYIVFGILTTIINLGVFYILNTFFGWEENVANLIAIIVAVLVAYVTNKDLVFHSEAKNLNEKFLEFIKFILGRAFTMVLEFVGGLLLFKLPIPSVITKLGLTIIVVILNFIISKFFAFKTKDINETEKVQ